MRWGAYQTLESKRGANPREGANLREGAKPNKYGMYIFYQIMKKAINCVHVSVSAK